MGMAYGRDLVRGSLSQYMPGAVTLWHSLRYYFDVNNTYVVRKMGVSSYCFFLHNKDCVIETFLKLTFLILLPISHPDFMLSFHKKKLGSPKSW